MARRQESTKSLRDTLAEFLAPYLKQKWLGCLVVAVVNRNESEIFRFGKISPENPESPGRNTVFELGSLTKPFTGLLLADAVVKGEVSLEDPVAAILPKRFRVPEYRGKKIALLDLVTHRSGLPKMPEDKVRRPLTEPSGVYTETQMENCLRQMTLTRMPGEQFEYSNLGFGLLGYALGCLSRNGYRKRIKEAICQPCGMDSTSCDLDAGRRRRFAQPWHVDGYAVKESEWLHKNDVFAGCGGLYSTISDLINFMKANFGHACRDLGKAIKLSHQPRGKAWDDNDMCLGWARSRMPRYIWHDGGTGGCVSHMAFNASRGTGFVLLATTNGGFLLSRASRLVLNHFAGEETELRSPSPVRSDCDVCVADYIGRYKTACASPRDMSLTIVETRGMLSTGRRQHREFCLWPVGDETFLNRSNGAIFTFRRDEYGKVHQLEVSHRGAGKAVFHREDRLKSL